jgi:hypothetical protein
MRPRACAVGPTCTTGMPPLISHTLASTTTAYGSHDVKRRCAKRRCRALHTLIIDIF